MELLYKDLKTLLSKDKIKFDRKQKINILIDVLKGLQDLEEKKYVHCDVKL